MLVWVCFYGEESSGEGLVEERVNDGQGRVGFCRTASEYEWGEGSGKSPENISPRKGTAPLGLQSWMPLCSPCSRLEGHI